MRKLRCAIYTRKSSEDGLEQEFNSLHAQREACAAYVTSQKAEGWVLLPQGYDDGGLSGGSLERPALQDLLAAVDRGEVDRGEVDQIIVYKIDRLTRSLSDFARIVDRLDAAGAFVCLRDSVLQHCHQHGTSDPEHAAVIRAVRARGDSRAHPRQDQRLEAEGPLDGWWRPHRL